MTSMDFSVSVPLFLLCFVTLDFIPFPFRLSFRICIREEFINLLFAPLAIATIRRRRGLLCFFFLFTSTWDVNKR